MVSLSLDWLGDLSFKNSAGSPAIELRSSSPGFTSPPQALAYSPIVGSGFHSTVLHYSENSGTMKDGIFAKATK